jgi:RsiW-degrading membrane proteinase PrsW (M82 family)
MAQTNLIFAPFGILPSLIWLLYYLKEDVRPEPKKMVVFIFLLGMLMSFPAFIFECLPFGFDKEGKLICKLQNFFSKIFPKPLSTIFYFFLAVGLIEEAAKYFPIKLFILKSKELDEPIDLIIYMIVSGLGFAAIENIFLAFSKESYFSILIGRFLSATLLHALCSGILGYFLALAFFEQKKKLLFLSSGFLLATGLHGLYDFSIIEIEGSLKIFIVFLILILAAILLKIFFQRSKKIKSVCKI